VKPPVQPACICFNQLSTLGQQLAHPLLFRQDHGGVLPMFPASTPRTRQPFGGSRYWHHRAYGIFHQPIDGPSLALSHEDRPTATEIEQLFGFVS
jgi:hypothetical protein